VSEAVLPRVPWRRWSLAIALLLGGCGARTELAVSFDAAVSPPNSVPDAAPDTPPPAPACVPGAAPTSLVIVESKASVLAVDEQNVYFIRDRPGSSDAPTLESVPKTGGSSTQLAIVPTGTWQQMLATATTIYLLQETAIYWVPKTGGTVTTLESNVDDMFWDMAEDDGFLFALGEAALVKWPTAGGPRQTVVQVPPTTVNYGLLNLHIAQHTLYWSDTNGDLHASAEDGTGDQVVFHTTQINDFVTDGSTAYVWIETFGPAHSMVSVPLTGAPSSTLLDGSRLSADGFAEDGALLSPTQLYWSESGFAKAGMLGLYELALPDGTPTLLTPEQPYVIEQDASCLYWMSGDAVRIVAK
jgi:hypothetical protein